MKVPKVETAPVGTMNGYSNGLLAAHANGYSNGHINGGLEPQDAVMDTQGEVGGVPVPEDDPMVMGMFLNLSIHFPF